ncbi:MAG: hypothetical protein MJ188_07870 [Treponema sp.]|nr:hypothetical protein [Treponema sp.]
MKKTLDHEGGLKVRVLEIGDRDSIENKNGVWLYVLTTASMWVESGDWIEKYRNRKIVSSRNDIGRF